jgi:hypothetical protein
VEELYNKIINASDENSLQAAIRNWVAQEENNPFPVNTEAFHLFFKAKIAYQKWIANGIDSRRSKQRMLEYVKEIVNLGVVNPYANKNDTEIVEEPAEEVVEEGAEEIVETPAEEPKKEPTHVFGVVPEKPFFGKRKKR